MARPSDSEYAPYYARYVSLVPEDGVQAVLAAQPAEVGRNAAGVNAGRERFRYAGGKWSIREVFGHIIDAERVFGYRAFCISRGETASLPSFDENSYVAVSHYDECELQDLLEEFSLVRKANLAVFEQLDDAQWKKMGTASGYPVSVRALAYIMAGHVRHHVIVLQERYGLPVAL